ncbi:MAG: IS1595 family transposase [Sphingobacteriia bacterium]|nr:IS1595 family transposase [Sphingobacteriia bacterium]
MESPTAGTIFHSLRFGQRKAFGIMFEMTATTKGISASQAARRYGISRTTARAFMQRVRSTMQSSKKYPIVGDVQVDEFVFGGKETLKQGRSKDSKKKTIVGAVEPSEKSQVKRIYFNKIDNYSSKSLSSIFENPLLTK